MPPNLLGRCLLIFFFLLGTEFPEFVLQDASTSPQEIPINIICFVLGTEFSEFVLQDACRSPPEVPAHACGVVGQANFLKVLCTVTLYSKYTRALTVENV
jgi:hypothetical protein